MKIHKAALLGAGAVGSYIIWGLSRCADIRSAWSPRESGRSA